MSYKRELCCVNCGLIWFYDVVFGEVPCCPECDSKILIIAVDTVFFHTMENSIVETIESRGCKIHYNREHPLYEGDDFIG